MVMLKLENILVVYNSDFNYFRKWCEYYGLFFFLIIDEVYVMYLIDLVVVGFKVSMIKRRMIFIF